jgi:hypothetical protein
MARTAGDAAAAAAAAALGSSSAKHSANFTKGSVGTTHGGSPFRMPAALDLVEVSWLAELLLPQMSHRKRVICRSLEELAEDATNARALLAETEAALNGTSGVGGAAAASGAVVGARNGSSGGTASARTGAAATGGVGDRLDKDLAAKLRPRAKAIVANIEFIHGALLASLQGLAMAERNLKNAQALGEMDLEEAAELVKVSHQLSSAA